MDDLFWLSDEAWAVIEPHLPQGRPGARRVDDRRVISGILHVLKSGCRWRDAPPAYGPRTTLYNRYNRWARQGDGGACSSAWPMQAAYLTSLRSTPLISRPTAPPVGVKGGSNGGDRPLARRAHEQDPRSG